MSSDPNRSTELLAPAGNWECARAAVANGADAIYFGMPRFNARIRADNFTPDDLPELMSFLHEHGVRGFVAFNTLIFTEELEAAAEQLRSLSEAGVDAIIVQDLGLATMARAIVPDLDLHASTQMTITSPEALAFANELFDLDRAVIARENSMREIRLFHANEPGAVELETFVHGALCVAYSGQCLTSESLGQRSANRGECAQACRMPYELIVDGRKLDLGDRRYLLSPQDLAGIEQIPELIRLGVTSFKVEGRLKTPEYVAAVTRAYRGAIDAAHDDCSLASIDADRYELEMAFSRGLSTGWLEGIDNQRLVHARFGKKRGALIGKVTRIGPDWVDFEGSVPVRKGDGIVFDSGDDTEREQGGRVYEVEGQRLFLKHGKIDFSRLEVGNRIWKTDDPALNGKLQKTWKREHLPVRKTPLRWRVRAACGFRLCIEDLDHEIRVESIAPLEAARNRPLSRE
ncbi:MAG: U32 family peptidase, partial [Verrucomicrobiota bacterium]